MTDANDHATDIARARALVDLNSEVATLRRLLNEAHIIAHGLCLRRAFPDDHSAVKDLVDRERKLTVALRHIGVIP